MFRRIIAFIIMTAAAAAAALPVSAAGPDLELTAQTAILIEQTTGKLLYGKNESERMYPASMTKILTALVALDYLKPGEFIVVGAEKSEAPAGSSVASLEIGETILVENLLRALLIPSGNEAGCVIAYNVGLRVNGVPEMPYDEAEALFSDLMNKKAAALGATGTHFTNPHGFHDASHYSTAHDIAMISRTFLQVPLLSAIVKEKRFAGNSAGDNAPEGAKTVEHEWKTHNELIMDNKEAYYTYANGIKTGFTDEASDCLASSAERDGVTLISVVFLSPKPGIWNDSQTLFEYGFNNFAFVDVQKDSELLEQAAINNPRLGEPEQMDVLSKGGFTGFYSNDESARIKREIVYDPALLARSGEEAPVSASAFEPPIERGQALGKVNYYLDGQVIYSSEAIAAANAYKRTLSSDFRYYLDLIKEKFFQMDAIKFWVGGAAILAALIIILAVRRRRRKRNQGFSMYRWR
ncbi:MAG: D-alanyl-D-alanine carboxypeptidase [Clostridiales bacterium]|jgi:D-alanyl-D-alanine carboxypeptidase (penicillin-binding protein 5/6)|nr:D-alanyl-D-alanine carboxypeptidase [Clostridiales bacterium]